MTEHEPLAVKHSIQLEDLQKRLETLEFKFNELIDGPRADGIGISQYLKVKEQ